MLETYRIHSYFSVIVKYSAHRTKQSRRSVYCLRINVSVPRDIVVFFVAVCTLFVVSEFPFGGTSTSRRNANAEGGNMDVWGSAKVWVVHLI